MRCLSVVSTPSGYGKTEYAWTRILDDNSQMLEEIASEGLCEINANKIKEYREPRLMTKHDASSAVPNPLSKRNLNVLPISKNSYVLGKFLLFEKFPKLSDLKPKHITMPSYETLNSDTITSEANAINALLASGILEDFLDEENVVETFNGRMGSGDFSFFVDTLSGESLNVDVHGAQIEIDGGFETADSVIIMEAKNVRHEDFLIRQLYYPFRKYHALVKKPIRLVFSLYTDFTYYLFEYRFIEPENYSSIELVNKAAYSFFDAQITTSEIWDVFESTAVATDDNQDCVNVPFIQADRVDRIISLMDKLSGEPSGLRTEEIAEFMQITERQAAYYPAAGSYLGVFDRTTRGVTKLSDRGQRIISMRYRERQLAMVSAMFEHQIFRDLFQEAFKSGVLPGKSEVISLMRKYNVCNPGEKGKTFNRRSQSVQAWLKWIMNLSDEEI